ncbi:MAG: hypothetical protein K8S87_03200 [Planctomycetes bacterium]|nr:hypothetical protein [Planctomycetota bacterium]
MTVSTTPFTQVYAFTKLLESMVEKEQVEKIYILPFSQPVDLSMRATSNFKNVELLHETVKNIFAGKEFITLNSTEIDELGKARLVFNQRDILLPDILFEDNTLIFNYALPVPDKKMLVYSGIANMIQFLTPEDKEYFSTLKKEEGLMFLGHLYSQFSAQFIHMMEINELITVNTSEIADMDPLIQYEKMHEIVMNEENYSKTDLNEFWISKDIRELDLFSFFKIWGERPVREGSWFFIPQDIPTIE